MFAAMEFPGMAAAMEGSGGYMKGCLGLVIGYVSVRMSFQLGDRNTYSMIVPLVAYASI